MIKRTILDKDKNIRKVDKKKMQDLLNKAPAVQSHRRGANSASTDIINDNAENLNPDVNNHEDIKYSQDDYQENLFLDNRKARVLRKVKGSYIPAEKVIELYKNADESTFLHEMAHWYFNLLHFYLKNNPEKQL